MISLPYHAVLSGGEMVARLLRPPSKNERVILTIPGGPGLGSGYLDSFVAELGRRTSSNAGVIDLPNHGASSVPPSRLPLSYQDCLDYLRKAVGELGGQVRGLALFGQSLGARLAFDLVQSELIRPSFMILVGFPYKFESSAELYRKMGDLGLEDISAGVDVEARFARNWRKIIPLNIHSPISPSDMEALASGTKWTGNEKMLDAAPDMKAAVTERFPPTTVFEGTFDPVVPEENLSHLEELIPRASFQRIENVGHFPMIEQRDVTLSLFEQAMKKMESGRHD